MTRLDPGLTINPKTVILVHEAFDASYYLDQYLASQCDDLNDYPSLLDHYLSKGWMLCLNPSSGFCVHEYLTEHPGLIAACVEPLSHYLCRLYEVVHADFDNNRVSFMRLPSRERFEADREFEVLRDERNPTSVGKTEIVDGDDGELLLSRYFDRKYYLETVPGLSDTETDPLQHYLQLGWREGRNPALWFDTKYYLKAHPDVERSGINPFRHYLVTGKAEGRLASGSAGYHREILDRLDARPYSKSLEDIDRTPKIGVVHITTLIKALLKDARGLVIAVTHDCYIYNTGGVQLFIAKEQQAFAAMRFVYLSISPLAPQLALAPSDERRAFIELVLDGSYLGVTSYKDLNKAIAATAKNNSFKNIFVVHCALGHQVDSVVSLQREVQANQNFFWLHDYSSVCRGYNLLRNNLEFCGGPSAESLSCRVCTYGHDRQTHLEDMRRLFEPVGFHVVAPSRAAMDVWTAAKEGLPHLSTIVHPHCHVETRVTPAPMVDRTSRTQDDPIRVAFIGQPASHKGWPAFQALVSQTRQLGAYRFYHFGLPTYANQTSGAEPVPVRPSTEDGTAMIEALSDHAIDLVLVLSTWPETFCYVAYEALAAGADVVAFAGSGNVAAVVREHKRGIIVVDEMALYELFQSLRVVDYVRTARADRRLNTLVHCGTTATIDIVAALNAEDC